MLRPEFFDIFGFFAFIFLIFIAVYVMKKVKRHPKPILYIILGIGIIGAIVDGIIVYTAYLK